MKYQFVMKQGIGVGGRQTALKRAGDQADIEPRHMSFAQKSHSVVVRAHAAGEPSQADDQGSAESPSY